MVRTLCFSQGFVIYKCEAMVLNVKLNSMKNTNTYWVDWYRNGWCYRSTHGVTWEQVKEMKKLAKYLGETIKYEKE